MEGMVWLGRCDIVLTALRLWLWCPMSPHVAAAKLSLGQEGEQATAPPARVKHLFQENHGSNSTQETSQPALLAADRSSGVAENQSLSVCSAPGAPTSQHHGAVPSRLRVPVKPHHRRAGLARPGEAVVAPSQLSWGRISCF